MLHRLAPFASLLFFSTMALAGPRSDGGEDFTSGSDVDLPGVCEIRVNEVKQKEVLYLKEVICGENPCAMPPVSVRAQTKDGKPRRFRLSYHYFSQNSVLRITLSDCDKTYEEPGDTFSTCQQIFSVTAPLVTGTPAYFTFGGSGSPDQKVVISCLKGTQP